MNKTTDNLFNPTTPKQRYSDLDYTKVKPLIDFARSLSQLTYQSIYLFDLHAGQFVYASENTLLNCGKTANLILKTGYSFYLQHVPSEDLKLLFKINQVGLDFFKTIKPENRCDYSICYDLHWSPGKTDPILINHKLTPLLLDRNSNIWIVLCVVSMSPNNDAGNIFIRQKGEDTIFEYDLTSESWIQKKVPILNSREKIIMRLSGQGLTMDDIARKLFLSKDTIKFHKKNIFQKLQARSISQAIASAEILNII